MHQAVIERSDRLPRLKRPVPPCAESCGTCGGEARGDRSSACPTEPGLWCRGVAGLALVAGKACVADAACDTSITESVASSVLCRYHRTEAGPPGHQEVRAA